SRAAGAVAAGNGVPRPPAEIGREGVPGGRPGAGAQPAWTQPHAPIEQQRAAGQFRPNEAPGARENAQPHATTPGAPAIFGGGRPAAQQAEPSRAPGFVPQPHAQPEQPRVEGARAEAAQPRLEPRAEPRAPTPQPAFARPPERQPAPQVERPQPHFEAPQAPRVEAPRIERPQPHFEPQQQPHFERPAAPPPAPHFERPAAPPPPRVEAPRPAPAQHESPGQGRQEHH
ncbi:FecR protein, partial [Burkholderia sp. Ax-1720]|nr:FecR protein [Burkholderia sp. Ax-1720]